VRADFRYQKALEYLVKNPNLMVREGMKLANFSPQEREDKSKYMMVNRLLNKARDNNFRTPPAQLIALTTMPTSKPISSITTTTAAESTVSSPPPQKATIPCSTATAAQLRHVVAVQKKREYNKAFKRATVVYARERAKGKSGMSARSVIELIRNKTKVELSAR
jgi:hypothetical protein